MAAPYTRIGEAGALVAYEPDIPFRFGAPRSTSIAS